MNTIQFEWDDNKAIINRKKHGITLVVKSELYPQEKQQNTNKNNISVSIRNGDLYERRI